MNYQMNQTPEEKEAMGIVQRKEENRTRQLIAGTQVQTATMTERSDLREVYHTEEGDPVDLDHAMSDLDDLMTPFQLAYFEATGEILGGDVLVMDN